ncbi:Transcriptional activator spt7 [Serendipita sp. 398]|nr:Transcriptional activator spt7 [Serendipita sp. 398]
MKHLLSALATRKLSLDVEEGDLKRLLSLAHRFRGDVKGGETWEETLEKVLVELRNSEYAAAFLKPVKKSEAWDYDRVISHPMDLQTMSRKIKSHSYMSKKAFADDLSLIWDNCLTYNTDPNHHLRRAAQLMRKKGDSILRRIPDRHERFAPSMIERFKYSTTTEVDKPLVNGTSGNRPAIEGASGSVNGVAGSDPGPTASATSIAPAASSASMVVAEASTSKAIIKAGTDTPFEDRPALERSAEIMGDFASLDAQMEEFLSTVDLAELSFAIPTLSQPLPDSIAAMTINGASNNVMDINQRLRYLADADDELAVWRTIVDETLDDPYKESSDTIKREESVDSNGSDISKKRKRLDGMLGPRKRQRLEKIVEPYKNPLENWWFAMGSTSLLANGIPANFESFPLPNPRHPAHIVSEPSAMEIHSSPEVTRKKDRRERKNMNLYRMMAQNVRSRKQARDIAIRIADQIEDEKQGVDPADLGPLVPLDPQSEHQIRQPWSQRAGLSTRRQQEYLEDDIGALEAQSCMESVSMLVLEHSNFDGSSSSALRAMGDIAGQCIQNLGRTLKILHETHHGKMTSEEMILHALFSNSVGNMHELEAYIKGDIIKHGANISSMLTTLEEVALKKDEPLDEDALLNDEAEFMTGLESLGEDIYGFRAMGLEMELGLKSLGVPKRLLRPKAKTETNNDGITREVERYPVPPPFIPLETKRIGDQIGLLRPYYQHRINLLIPPPPPPPLPPIVQPPVIQPPIFQPSVVQLSPQVSTPPNITSAIISESPTSEMFSTVPPEPSTIQQPTTPTPTLTALPAPIFDPYNPSSLSIQVPIKPIGVPVAPSPKPVTTSLPTPLVQPMDLTPAEGSAPATPVNPLFIKAPTPAQTLAPDIVMPYTPIEIPLFLEDDVPDPGRVRVGPLGQIQVPSAATVAKQKRQHRAAAQAKASAAIAASNATPGTPVNTNISIQSPVSATKPKKVTPKKPKKTETPVPSS